MRGFGVIGALLAAAVVAALGANRASAAEKAEVIPVTIETAAGSHTLQAEIACTLDERRQGLMGRPSLAPDAGMIFLLPAPRPMRMWMKDTPLSLDLIFFDSEGNIIRIENNAESMSERVIESGGAVVGVLEIAGGRAVALGISSHDKLLYSYPQARCE